MKWGWCVTEVWTTVFKKPEDQLLKPVLTLSLTPWSLRWLSCPFTSACERSQQNRKQVQLHTAARPVAEWDDCGFLLLYNVIAICRKSKQGIAAYHELVWHHIDLDFMSHTYTTGTQQQWNTSSKFTVLYTWFLVLAQLFPKPFQQP